MKNKKTNNSVTLTQGPILHSLTALALPIMASSFLSTIYSITDMAWIGLLGSKAVAGVGVGGMYVWLSQGLATLPRMGGQVYAAQKLGSGNYKEAREYARNSLQMTFVLGLLFCIISLLFTKELVGFFHLDDVEAYDSALIYTRIACGMILFAFLNITLTGLYTAQGDSKTPFVANLIGLIINMILDPVLILGIGFLPKAGVAGAAIATVTAQFIVFLVMAIQIIRSDSEQNIFKNMRLFHAPSLSHITSICRMGGPSSIQSMAYCMISMVITRMVSSFGADAIATQRVGGQIESVSWNTADGFAAALNAFIGQNYGAGHMDRVRKGYRISIITMALWGLLITFIFILFPAPIARIFFHEANAVTTAMGYLIITGFSETFLCIEITTVGALSGLGMTKLCSIISITITASRIPLALILKSTALGLNGIWWALTLTSIIKGVLFYLAFRYHAKCL